MSDEPPDDLIPTSRAAKILKVQGRTIRGWIDAGKLAGWQLAGGRLLVSEADVRALLAPVRVKPRLVIIPTAQAVAVRKKHTQEVLRKHGLA